jgi:hypothetical protein
VRRSCRSPRKRSEATARYRRREAGRTSSRAHPRGLFRLAGERLHRRRTTAYLIWSYTLNIGMYIEITMKPTMLPTSTIITGSRIDVSALTAAATSSS